MQQLGFGERLLRFVFVGPDRCLIKVLSDVEIGPRPVLAQLNELMSALRVLVDDVGGGSSVAFLLTRPGRGGLSQTDREWGRVLVEAAASFDVPIEPIFRANDEAVLLVTPRAKAA